MSHNLLINPQPSRPKEVACKEVTVSVILHPVTNGTGLKAKESNVFVGCCCCLVVLWVIFLGWCIGAYLVLLGAYSRL